MLKSTAVTGPYTPTPSTYNSANGTLTTASTGASTGFYRLKTDTYGVVLGSPQVSGTNVTMSVAK